MTVDFSKRVVVPQNVMFRDLDGEAVLLNLDNENYYGLDKVGTRMWSVLSSTESIQAAYEKLITEYETEPEVLKEDLSELLLNLQSQGLIDFKED